MDGPYRNSMANNCSSVKFHILVLGTFSHFLLTTNSSSNFFIYCMMSTEFRVTIAVSICAWFLKCQFGSLLQTRKKIDYETNSIFCWVRTWFLQATQAVKIKFELEKKNQVWIEIDFFFEFVINSQIDISKIKHR